MKFDAFGLVDIAPAVLLPTWSNRRVGCDNICKRLDRLLVSADLLDLDFYFRQWVECGGDSDHHPVFLHISNGENKPRSPFKFNSHWLKDEWFVKLLKDSWKVYEDNDLVTPTTHFTSNLKILKDVYICWSVEKHAQDCKDIVAIELKLIESFNKLGFVFFLEEVKTMLIGLEARKRLILLDREHAACQQSRAVWLTCGDDNIDFFHKYACFRKHVNSI